MAEQCEEILSYLSSLTIAADDSENFRFDFRDPEAYVYLEEKGYVVLENVVDEKEVEEIVSLFWSWAEQLGKGIDRREPSTWENWVGFLETGVIPEPGIGQSEMMWRVREQESVRKVFENVWGTDELLSSFDGCGAFRPVNENPKWKTNPGWWHVDQNPNLKKGRHCVQGLLSLTEQTLHTGGFICKPEGLPYFQNLSTDVTYDFVALSEEKHDDILNLESQFVSCKKGDMVLWDSRLPHCNTPSENPRICEAGELLRHVAYVCMTPKSFANSEIITKRKQYVQHGITTNHWPHDPDRASIATTFPTDIQMNDIRKKLIGYDAGEEEIEFCVNQDWVQNPGYFTAG